MTRHLPNILLVITDQQRIDTLGFRGESSCLTPHMDRLAREGLAFDRALCASPLCLPSRAALFTGQYPHQIAMMRNSDVVQTPPHLTDALRKLGYHTAYAGKWHLEPAGLPKGIAQDAQRLGLAGLEGGPAATKGRRKVDRWFDAADGQATGPYTEWCLAQGLPDGWAFSDPDVRSHRTPSMSIPRTKVLSIPPDKTYDAWVTDIALGFLSNRPNNRPFFLVTSFFGPHPPFMIPEPYYSMYRPDKIPPPPNFGPQPGEPRANANSYYRQLFCDHGTRWEDWQKPTAVYWGYTTMMDDLLGRLLDRLTADGILDNTLVIFCSDHGEMLGSHGLWHKMMPYEECLRVPLLMRLPGTIRPGVRSQAMASLIDIPATILSLVGAKVPPEYAGRDLSPAFVQEREFQSDPYRFSEQRPLGDWHGTVEWRLVADDRHKFVWNRRDRHELFDLRSDPYELRNLFGDPALAEVESQLKKRLHRWMRETNDYLLPDFEGEMLPWPACGTNETP